MGRSLRKGPFVDHHLLDKVVKLIEAEEKVDHKHGRDDL